MAKSIFDLISCVTDQKTHWKDLEESDKKQWGIYMVNRFLSMDMNLLNIVAQTQQYTMEMPPSMSYEVYKDFLPKKKLYLKYTKAEGEKEKKKQQVINHLCKSLLISQKEASEYIDLLLDTRRENELVEFTQKFGYTEKELEKIFK